MGESTGTRKDESTVAEQVQEFTVLFSFYFVSNVILKCRVFLRVWQLPDGSDTALLH